MYEPKVHYEGSDTFVIASGGTLRLDPGAIVDHPDHRAAAFNQRLDHDRPRPRKRLSCVLN